MPKKDTDVTLRSPVPDGEMMIFMQEALKASDNCPEKHDFKIGDKVRILNDDYYGQAAVVEGLSLNLLGKPLLVCKIMSETWPGSRSPCFYPYEVEHAS